MINVASLKGFGREILKVSGKLPANRMSILARNSAKIKGRAEKESIEMTQTKIMKALRSIAGKKV